MKKFYIPYIVFCILILTLFVTNLKNSPKKQVAEVKQSLIQNEEKRTDVTETEFIENKYFIVRANDNKIFLYDNNDNIIEKLNIDYLTLREYDKNQFLNGIKVNNMQEVYQLIEDFSN